MKSKLSIWYWYLYVQTWLLWLCIPVVIIGIPLGWFGGIGLLRLIWLLPLLIWLGHREMKKEKTKADTKEQTKS